MTERHPNSGPTTSEGSLQPVHFTARTRPTRELYVPDRRLLEPELRIQQQRTIRVDWRFNEGAYMNLLQGYKSGSQDEKWYIYTDRDIYHAHRASTGNEIFVMPLYHRQGLGYVANRFVVEQDSERFRATDERTIAGLMINALGWAGVVVAPMEQ